MSVIQTYIKPSTIDTGALTIKKKGDLAIGLEEFENKTSKRFGVEGDYSYLGKPFLLSFKAYVASEGVVARDWSINGKSGKYYTLSVSISDEEDAHAFQGFCDKITSDLKGSGVNADEWGTYNPVKGDVINLKMKAVGGRFNCRFNGHKLKVDEDTGLEVGTEVEVVGTLGVDYTFESLQAKLQFTATRIKF